MHDTTSIDESADKRSAYRERSLLLAWITATTAEAVLSYSDPNLAEMAVLHIASAAGPLTWHIHRDDLELFGHVAWVAPTDPRAAWDQATKAETLRRVEALARDRRDDRPAVGDMSSAQVTAHIDDFCRPTGRAARKEHDDERIP